MWDADDGEAAAISTLNLMRNAISTPVLAAKQFHTNGSGRGGEFFARQTE
jgi:hypothetical protein